METKIEIGKTIQLELKSKTPIIFGKFGGGITKHGLIYKGKLVERIWLKNKEDYKLKFANDTDDNFTHFFEGCIDRQFNIVKIF